MNKKNLFIVSALIAASLFHECMFAIPEITSLRDYINTYGVHPNTYGIVDLTQDYTTPGGFGVPAVQITSLDGLEMLPQNASELRVSGNIRNFPDNIFQRAPQLVRITINGTAYQNPNSHLLRGIHNLDNLNFNSRGGSAARAVRPRP